MKRITPDNKPLIAPGYHFDMDMEDYHEDPAISKSGLVDLETSPLYYVAQRTQVENKETKAMSIGTLAHALILQPDDLNKIAIVPPIEVLAKNGAFSGNKYLEWKAQALEANPGIEIIKSNIMDTGQQMADQVLNNPEHEEAKILLTNGMSEVSFFWEDPELGIRIKVRPDHLPGGKIITDLKTCRSAEEHKFGADSFKLHYHWSAYLTCKVISEVQGAFHNDYRFVALENEPPFDVCIYKPDAGQMQAAKDEVEHWLRVYAEAYKSDTWPGHEANTRPLYWPHWAWSQVRYRDEFNPYDD